MWSTRFLGSLHPWCKALAVDLARGVVDHKLDITSHNGLIFIRSRLIIPNNKQLRENLFHLAHDNLGHFGGNKSYNILWNNFYWPNMQWDLINVYIPLCTECQHNKSQTSKPTGPLHPLPIPDKWFKSVAIDFVGPLLTDDGFDAIVMMTGRLGANIQLAPCNTNITAEEFSTIFFDKWFCENGCPQELITDRDKLFVLQFWKALMKLLGIKHKMSTAFHPQMDGASKCSNKTVVQALRFHVEQNQTGWAKALPRVHFNIMNTVNVSTGFSPFALKSGHSPQLILPLIDTLTPRPSNTNMSITTPNTPTPPTSDGEDNAHTMIEQLTTDILEARDSLTAAKISQAHHANKDRSPDPTFQIRDWVLLATAHWWQDYMQKKDGHVAKFMPCFNGLFKVTSAFPKSSTYMLWLPESSKILWTFHSSLLQPHFENDNELFPSQALDSPGPIMTEDGEVEYYIDKIINEWTRSWSKQYLVWWLGYGPESDLWLPWCELADTDVYAEWIKNHK